MSSEKNSASLKTEQSDEVRKLQFKICSENEMLKFGQTVAKELFPGAFIAMFGDLGAGKTTFVRGIAAELQIDDIASPTFTIVRSHRGSVLSLDHFDAYRLENFDELFAIGYQDYLDSESVIVMEWCENVPEALPRERLELRLAGSGSEPRSVEALAFGERYEALLGKVANTYGKG